MVTISGQAGEIGEAGHHAVGGLRFKTHLSFGAANAAWCAADTSTHGRVRYCDFAGVFNLCSSSLDAGLDIVL